MGSAYGAGAGPGPDNGGTWFGAANPKGCWRGRSKRLCTSGPPYGAGEGPANGGALFGAANADSGRPAGEEKDDDDDDDDKAEEDDEEDEEEEEEDEWACGPDELAMVAWLAC